MSRIIPRWEWRTFARDLDIRVNPADYPLTRELQSSEIYLVSASSRDNPKIRDGKLDIKALERRNPDGLEQWKPVMKTAFPLSLDQVASVRGILGLGAAASEDERTLEGLLQAVEGTPEVWAVRVEKTRRQYDVDGCIVEDSRVSFDGEMFRTIAAEDPDPAKVAATVAHLGLSRRENLNYVLAVQRFKAGGLN